MNRPLRSTLLAVLAVALVAVGAVGGALFKGEKTKPPKKFSEVTGENTPCAMSKSVLDRVVPAAHYADRSQGSIREKLRRSYRCRIVVDDKQVLELTIEQLDSVHKPRKAGTGPGHGKTKSIPGYEQSWSSDDTAGLSVPCTKNTGNDNATSLYVRAQATREPYEGLRADMVRIAKRAAKTYRTPTCKIAPVVEDLD